MPSIRNSGPPSQNVSEDAATSGTLAQFFGFAEQLPSAVGIPVAAIGFIFVFAFLLCFIS